VPGTSNRASGRNGRRRVQRGGRRRTDRPGAFPTLLIVDDDDAARSVLQQFFETSHFRVEAVSDGRSALECLASVRPHLIVAGAVRSTAEDDWLAFVAGRPADGRVPIVALSGEAPVLEETSAPNCAAVVARSAPPDVLLERIRDVFRQNPRVLAGAG